MPIIDTSGASLFYTRDGSGPPVLLIQGVGAPGSAWRPQVDGTCGALFGRHLRQPRHGPEPVLDGR